MDHVAAVRVELDDGSNRYFLTLGRAFDSAEPRELLQLVVEHAGNCDLQAKVRDAHICETIREAAESLDAPFFYEALLAVGRLSMPSAKRHGAGGHAGACVGEKTSTIAEARRAANTSAQGSLRARHERLSPQRGIDRMFRQSGQPCVRHEPAVDVRSWSVGHPESSVPSAFRRQLPDGQRPHRWPRPSAAAHECCCKGRRCETVSTVIL